MKEINDFILWTKKPNTIVKGAKIYTRYFKIDTDNSFTNRLVRVYLPSTYDFSNPNKRFPVIYMLDGKNLFDDHTSFVGEWGVDEAIEKAIKDKLTEGIIVVGIDAPGTDIDRTMEMIPLGIEAKYKELRERKGYAQKLGKFIFNDVKNVIDDTFYTLKDKKHTGVGGSSMGGLMAFYLALDFRQYIAYSLCFSPAFFLFKKKSFTEYLKNNIHQGDYLPKLYLYVGGGERFERMFISSTLLLDQYLYSTGYKDNYKCVYDSSLIHNEKAWKIYFPEAIKYFDYLK